MCMLATFQMPKIRQHKRPAVQALLVSPWQKKKERTSTPQQSTEVSHEPLMYSIKTSGSLLSYHNQHNTTAVRAMHEAAAPTPAAIPTISSTIHRFTSSNGVPNHCSDSGAPWHVRHKQSVMLPDKPAAPPSQTSSIQSPVLPGNHSVRQGVGNGHSSVPSSSVAVIQPVWGSPATTEKSQLLPGRDVEGASFSGHAPCMHGTAQLALFPNGQISGLCRLCSPIERAAICHAADHDSSNKQWICLRIEGQQVLGIHSCYRDPEWALLEVRISRHTGPALQTFAAGKLETRVDAAAAAAAVAVAAATTGREHDAGAGLAQADIITWVQRRGGDLTSLSPADMDDEDTEVAIRNSNLGSLPAGICLLNFAPHTLLSGPAAAAALDGLEWGSSDPSQDIVVNLGEVSIAGLPVTFVLP